MIPDLERKANNEKYFKSIRYFSHSLKGERRRNYILDVAEQNIYLAAQCVMSAEKDEEFEEVLIQKSRTDASDFNDSEKSAKGFLALAEFESYEIISKLLLEVKKPSKIHLQVFVKILEGNNSNTFISFIEILIKIKKIQFIHYASSAYNGQLLVNSENKDTLSKLLNFLLQNGNFGMARVIIEKYNLYEDIQYILNSEPREIISTLLKSSRKQITASKLAYAICRYFNLFEQYPGEVFIELTLQKKGKSIKNLVFALEVALRQTIRNNKWIDIELERIASESNRNTKNKVNRLIKIGLFDYLKNDEPLFKKIKSIQTDTFSNDSYTNMPKHKQTYQLEFSIKTPEKQQGEYKITDDLPIQDCLDLYFRNPGKSPIDLFLRALIKKYSSSCMEVSHLLRAFEFEGSIKYILDYGCYIQPFQFKASNLLFLHRNQITNDKDIIDLKEHFREGQIIKFRIIGINQTNFRLNVSCLELFNPKYST